MLMSLISLRLLLNELLIFILIFYLILNDGRHPEIEFILLHLEDKEAMANDFSGEVTTLKHIHLI